MGVLFKMRVAGLSVSATWVVLGLLLTVPAFSSTLKVEDGKESRSFDASELLSRSDAADIEVPKDVAYGGLRRYRAVPLDAVLSALPIPPGSELEAVAADGFAAQIPLSLAVQNRPGASRAWLAIEPSDAPWVALPGKTASAGPFYIVWLQPESSRISPEYWAYQVTALRYVPAPLTRWPQIAVDPSLPSDDPARQGQEVFVATCLACHRINGGGSSAIGPDLNQPMNPTEYFQPSALRRFIRDPGSVRSWPEQKMPGFSPEQISEEQLDAVVAYLTRMAGRRAP